MGERTGENELEFFDDECRKEIASILRLESDPRFSQFWDAIRTRGKDMRTKIMAMPSSFEISPFDRSLSKRIEWLTRNVVIPCEKIENALLDQNLPNFEHWEIECEIKPKQIDDLRQSLTELKRIGRDLASILADEIDQDISHNSEIKHDIVFNALADLHQHYPSIPLARGNWDAELGEMVGVVPAYVRRVYLETTGNDEKLDAQIQEVIREQRKNQRTLG